MLTGDDIKSLLQLLNSTRSINSVRTSCSINHNDAAQEGNNNINNLDDVEKNGNLIDTTNFLSNKMYVTIGITSCKRFHYYSKVIAQIERILYHHLLPSCETNNTLRFCVQEVNNSGYADPLFLNHFTITFLQIIVVDDGSSKQDRIKMLELHPNHTYLFRSSQLGKVM